MPRAAAAGAGGYAGLAEGPAEETPVEVGRKRTSKPRAGRRGHRWRLAGGGGEAPPEPSPPTARARRGGFGVAEWGVREGEGMVGGGHGAKSPSLVLDPTFICRS